MAPSQAAHVLIAVYLLDTNVISELRKTRPHGAVKAWLSAVDARDLYRSAVSLGEIQTGIEITRDVLTQEIENRDRRDSTRQVSPLVRADDAVELDTSRMSVDEVVDELERAVRAQDRT